VSAALAAARQALAGEPAWVVGGSVRDELLGRDVADADLVTSADAAQLARRLARAAGAAVFPLSEAFGAWRVAARDGAWHADVLPLQGDTIEDDLARRDFTINAMARPLAGGDLVDPFGGGADLEARRLRMVSERAFEDDPLRVLRLARLACELELSADARTVDAAARHAPALERVAGERVFAELKRVVAAPRVLDGLALMDATGATAVVLPELSGQRGVEQSRYHHLDVHDHTLAVLAELLELEREPEPALGEHARAAMRVLAEPLADDLTRSQALRFGALLHDAAKPQTRSITPEGRVTFLGHDDAGAGLARDVLARLRASERLRAHVAALTRHHLRLGFLVHRRPLSRRALHDYLRACTPVEVDVTVLSVADRLATRGHRAEESIARHLDLAREVLGEALRWREAGPPPPLLRGDELTSEAGVEPGPEVGRVLAELEAARFAGEIATREDALRLARRLAGAPRAGG
jgi:putative nucleotidyltransferase with HDIG domain